ncbi:MAG: anti-sigma factor [Planctomycetota bacterium]
MTERERPLDEGPDERFESMIDAGAGSGDPLGDPDEVAAALTQAGLADRSEMPRGLRERVLLEGEAVVGASRGGSSAGGGPRRGASPFVLMATGLIAATLAAAVLLFAYVSTTGRLESSRDRLAEATAQIEANEALLASLRVERDSAIARLADATSDLARLDDLERELAVLRGDRTPAEVRRDYETLAGLPGTVRLEFSPFLGGEAAEIARAVRGDVVWNPEAKAGFFRLDGLRPNDPENQQYQAWIIDDRGDEQKVSSGVFDAVAGELIVPLDPSLAIGDPRLFAISIEEPGGMAVPDLNKLVVIAQPGG